MNNYFKYLKYITLHKWYVAKECFKYKLYWRGVMHDMSKLLPSEFFPYLNFFYGKQKTTNNFYVPGKDNKFDTAWLKHQHRNPHHWQYWVLSRDERSISCLEMPEKYMIEMLCD